MRMNRDLSEDLTEYVLGSITTAVLADKPWPHAYIPEALPTDLALGLSRSFDRFDMQTVEKTGTEKPYRFRTTALDQAAVYTLPTAAWTVLAGLLSEPSYRSAIGRLTGLSLRYSDFALNLWEYQAGDWLAPHVDKPEKIVTQIFYLTDRWDHADGGRLLILDTADPASVVHALPPLLGSSAILVRSSSSWHAVESPGPRAAYRRSITATFWHRPSVGG